MTVDPEAIGQAEFSEVEQLAPSFEFDEDADSALINQLRIDVNWLMSRPATRLLALRQFAENPESAGQDSPWRRLTDRQTSKNYWFDATTMRALKRDPRHVDLTARGGRRNISEAEAEEIGFKKRVRSLEVFLERAKAIKAIGNISLDEAE
ncbi:MAG: hypothetical protein WC498_02125 [Candidatus Saccharimonadales bacterium]